MMILSTSRTLIEDLEYAKSKGYTEEFIFSENTLLGRYNNKTYNQDECILKEYCVHSGKSDPTDQSIIFLIKSSDGTQGCLSSSYGTYADTELIEIILSIKKEE
jgi:hypothetical protein